MDYPIKNLEIYISELDMNGRCIADQMGGSMCKDHSRILFANGSIIILKGEDKDNQIGGIYERSRD